MKFNRITIKGFQSHSDTVIDLHDGVNVIVGESHVGKSAVIRAINWVLRNRPLGNSFIKTGEKTAHVIIETDSGIVVERIKNKKENKYILRIGDEKEEVNAGSGVPEPVLEALNLSDVNIQRQHDPYFLIFDSPGNVASTIRSATGLDDIDLVAAEISKRLRSATTDINSTERDIEELDSALEEIDAIDLDALQSAITRSENIISELNEVQSRSSDLEDFVNRLRDLEDVVCLDQDRISQLFDSLDSLTEEWNDLCKGQKDLGKLVESLQDIESVPDIPDCSDFLDHYDGLIKRYSKIVDDMDSLEELLSRLGNAQESIDDIELGLEIAQKEEAQLLEEIDVCVYCGSELDEGSRERLLGEMDEYLGDS